MGYLCPVCETPFADAQSLADHLAVTAMLHSDDHETWLADTVPDWESCDRATVADSVVDHATEVDAEHPSESGHPDDNADQPAPTAAQPGPIQSDGARQQLTAGDTPDSAAMAAGLDDTLDAEAQSILQEARAFTQAMQGDREPSASETETADSPTNDES